MTTDLTGKYFVTFDDDNLVDWQGQVDADDGTHVLVMLHEWLMGEPNGQVLLRKADLVTPINGQSVIFYDDPEWWRQSASEYSDAAAQQRKRKAPA